MTEETKTVGSDARRVALKLLRTYGREEALSLVNDLAEVDRDAGRLPDVEWWEEVRQLIEVTTFEIVSTGPDKFKIRWFMPPEGASLRVIK